MSEADHKVYKELALNRPAKDIAADLDMSYSAVLRLKKQYNEAKLQGTLNQLMQVERTVLEHAAEEIGASPEVAHELTKGLNGLETLSEALQKTALQINTKVQSYVLSADPHELGQYAEIIALLQKSFLGKDQVNIQVNNGGGGENQSQAYRAFLGDKPGG